MSKSLPEQTYGQVNDSTRNKREKLMDHILDVAQEAEEFSNFLADLSKYPLNLDEVAATGELVESKRNASERTSSVQNFQ